MAAIFCLLFVGCEKASWQSAPIKYKCSEEQFIKVKSNTEWCAKNTDYNRNYCYGTQIIQNCELIKVNQQPAGQDK
jgi:hypothetical protein